MLQRGTKINKYVQQNQTSDRAVVKRPIPFKCFQWSTLSHYSPSEQHQVPSPKNNHHHNINCVGSTSTAVETYIFVLWMDDNTIAHKKSFEHYTTLGMGFLLLVLDILNESSWDMGASLLYADRTNSDTHESFRFLLQTLLRDVSGANTCLILYRHIVSH